MFIDHSRPRGDYFLAVQRALGKADIATPVLVIDRHRLDANLERLRSDLPAGLALRLVSKSLPCLPLLARARAATGTDRLMTFNLPMLIELARAMPDADQLLGKPLPVAAAARFYRQELDPRAVERVHWLVDTEERLHEYGSLAENLGRRLSLALELDVGLHRGGFEPGPDLGRALETLHRNPNVQFAGFMGYEAHLSKVPTFGGWRRRQAEKSWQVYGQANAQAAEVLGQAVIDGAIRNAAGSPTFRLYQDDGVANELALGSALVKPTDFDTDLLEAYEPALFIATPALKVLDQTRIPVIEPLGRLEQWLDPNLAQTVFIHGGYWKAQPVDPPGLRTNPTYGRSTNQEMLNIGKRATIEADDFVFLRPTQSEAVLLQFGEIAVYEDGKIRDTWPTLPPSA